MRQVIRGPSGSIAGFDTQMMPGVQWHDLVRNEGIEDISLSRHECITRSRSAITARGSTGNSYRSVSTIWKDIPTGMLIFGTYQHIAGRPEIDDPLLPTAIIPAKVDRHPNHGGSSPKPQIVERFVGGMDQRGLDGAEEIPTLRFGRPWVHCGGDQEIYPKLRLRQNAEPAGKRIDELMPIHPRLEPRGREHQVQIAHVGPGFDQAAVLEHPFIEGIGPSPGRY